ncbi:LytR/AlgR family response regulator transcription factor [Rhizosphaericola mali]|uniref:Response regulator transcription factor n=1 Tax=Rhizosphaericola mali TaxID=2545455 RepID=A0A5P2G3U6_9BACT|nr:LytTR family DNA-binding domain-containing protein [Rhizosphaericola mali]QES87763.1 response regulator transcription factor [Rhizosphaericola mali]
MPPISAIIVDDELGNIENLHLLIRKYCPNVNVLDFTPNVDQAILKIKELQPQLIFLDIQMPNKNGFDLLKSFANPQFEVIFVTAFDQFAIQAIRFSAIDYLLKPINISELQNAIERASKNLENKSNNSKLENLILSINQKALSKIAINSSRETIFIDPKELLFCKSDNNYTHLYLQDHTKITSSKPIFEYEELLENQGFFRCHQSYLVNLTHIKSWIKQDGDRLLINEGFEIPIARNKKERLKKVMGLS